MINSSGPVTDIKHSLIYSTDFYNYSRREIKITVLEADEIQLLGGRFKNFTLIPQEHIVIKPARQGTFYEDCQHQIEMISINVTGKWSMDLAYGSINNIDVLYSFANPNDAVVFKLAS